MKSLGWRYYECFVAFRMICSALSLKLMKPIISDNAGFFPYQATPITLDPFSEVIDGFRFLKDWQSAIIVLWFLNVGLSTTR